MYIKFSNQRYQKIYSFCLVKLKKRHIKCLAQTFTLLVKRYVQRIIKVWKQIMKQILLLISLFQRVILSHKDCLPGDTALMLVSGTGEASSSLQDRHVAEHELGGRCELFEHNQLKKQMRECYKHHEFPHHYNLDIIFLLL